MRKNRPQTTDHRPQIINFYRKKNSPESEVWSLKSERGIVLVVALLLLLVATVVGITALSTTTTTVMISGNQRLSEINFRSADSCISVSVPILEQSLYGKQVPAVYSLDPDLTISPTFPNEARLDADCPVQSSNCASPAPDLQYTSGAGATAVIVSADFDLAYPKRKEGSSMLMLHGYEGLGVTAAFSSSEIWKISCFAEGPLGSQANVCGIYEHVSNEE